MSEVNEKKQDGVHILGCQSIGTVNIMKEECKNDRDCVMDLSYRMTENNANNKMLYEAVLKIAAANQSLSKSLEMMVKKIIGEENLTNSADK